MNGIRRVARIMKSKPTIEGAGVYLNRVFGYYETANLPAGKKMADPKYRDVKAGMIPAVKTGQGALIRVICGSVDNVSGPVTDISIEPEYLDVTIPADTVFKHGTRDNHTVIAYVIEGNACFDDRYQEEHKIDSPRYFDFEKKNRVDNGHLVVFDKGDEINIKTYDNPVRFLLISGKPLKEPIAWYGPIVMNTEEELNIAFDEYRKGTFIKKRS